MAAVPDDLVTLHEAALAMGVDALSVSTWVEAGLLESHERVSAAQVRELLDRLREHGRPLAPDYSLLVDHALLQAELALSRARDRTRFGQLELPFPEEDLVRMMDAIRRRRELLREQRERGPRPPQPSSSTSS